MYFQRTLAHDKLQNVSGKTTRIDSFTFLLGLGATMLITPEWFHARHATSGDWHRLYIDIRNIISYRKKRDQQSAKVRISSRIEILSLLKGSSISGEKLVWEQIFSVASSLKIALSFVFRVERKSLNERNMMISPSMSLLAAGVASGIFLLISLRSR